MFSSYTTSMASYCTTRGLAKEERRMEDKRTRKKSTHRDSKIETGPARCCQKRD